MNQLILDGTVVDLDEIRFTPAQIPVRNFKIHFKDLTKLTLHKHVEFEINALMVGDLTKKEIKEQMLYKFHGFLDRRSQKSNQIIFHVQEYI